MEAEPQGASPAEDPAQSTTEAAFRPNPAFEAGLKAFGIERPEPVEVSDESDESP